MLRHVSRVAVFAATATMAISAGASTTGLRVDGAQASFRANQGGNLWSDIGRRDARTCGTFAERLEDEEPDQRDQYKGLLTDAILRLVKDLKPYLA